MKKSEIKVGGRYAAKVNGRVVVVRVLGIREVGWETRNPTRYDVVNEATGRKTSFRSATKFRSEVGADARPTSPSLDATPAATATSAAVVPLTSAGSVGPCGDCYGLGEAQGGVTCVVCSDPSTPAPSLDLDALAVLPVSRFVLENGPLHRIVYEPRPDGRVIVTRTNRGVEALKANFSLAAAREHWRKARRWGYRRVDNF